MEKILSQEEISALVQGIEEGKVDVNGGKTKGADALSYDFTNPKPGLQPEMPALVSLNEHFCRFFRQSLSLVLRKGVQVFSSQSQPIRYGDFMQTQSVPASMHILRMDPLRGHALLVLEPKLIFALVDIFLGGSGKGSFPIEGRDFTAVETRLIQKIVSQILKDLEKAWNTIHPFVFHYLRGEKNPQMVALAEASEWMFTASYTLEMEQPLGMFSFCFPLTMMEPIKDKLSGVQKKESAEVDSGWVERLADRLKTAEVEVVIEFGRGQMKAQDLLGLKAGDILPLGKDMAEPLIAKIQGIPKFLGKGGLYGANKAFQIEQKIT